MKQFLELCAVLALLQGVGGLVHEGTGWLEGQGLVQRIGFLDGYEVYASTALVVLGIALLAAAGRVGKDGG